MVTATRAINWAAAALASWELLHQPKAKVRRKSMERVLARELDSLWALAAVGDVRWEGLVVGVELVADWKTRRAFTLKDRAGIRVCEAMARRGVLTRPIGNVIPLLPPYCTTDAQLRRMVRVLRESIRKCSALAGLIARRADALDQFHGFFRRRFRITGNGECDHEVHNAPTAPKALGVMPRNQFSSMLPKNEVPGINMMPLCWNT